MVGAYMTDPLWIAEYTLYLEQNFCVGHPDRCKEAVKVREAVFSTLIGRGMSRLGSHWSRDVAAPALLCHKEPARASKAPY